MDTMITTVIRRIDALLLSGNPVIVAIDGYCTAGKTTLAQRLAGHYDCNVFHMDDFFLRSHQRTQERLSQPGGNVDYERFREEVLLPLKKTEGFSYRRYDCASRCLSEPVPVEPKQLTIIEGTYSLHPHFEAPYDLKIFLSAAPQVQLQRLKGRPAALYRRFLEEWIPMEHRYFAHFSIREQCDLAFGTSDSAPL